jgi:carbon-monoxide dehydrogenase medium subunit
VKPAPFDYLRPVSLDEALGALAAHGGAAKPLAGGQSLVPAMNFRVAQPAVLVDLNRVPGLDAIETTSEGLRVGAMVRHRTLETSPLVSAAAPLVTATMPHIAHLPIRTRGTLGGSLAHADPAAELPAVMLALDAVIGVAGASGRRTVAAAEFFTGLYATTLDPTELVTGVTIPALPANAGWAFEEVARRHGDFALAGAAAVVALDATGAIGHVRIALFGVHDRALVAASAMQALAGQAPTPAAIAAAAAAAAANDADPATDIHASAAFRRHLTGVVVRRVLQRAVAGTARAAAS